MSDVAKMLWVLESRLTEPVSLDDLVEVTGRSKSYLSRAFPLATGYSISGYMRARRLTEAARTLADGAPDILSVALDAGYGSHEAFTRAFGDQFGITPDVLRRGRNLEAIQLVEPQRMDTTATIDIAPPRFVTSSRMHFAGIAQRHPMNNPAGIPAQWQQFQAYIGNIEGAVTDAAYGIVGGMEGGNFDYIVAVEVREGADVQPELKRITIPALNWARFVHQGDVTTIRSTIGAASEWLADAGRELSDAPFAFLEYYGPAFDTASGAGDIEIWFGLKA
ncbi:AraC family transcriptional regulator [Devosia sp. UYZn731]|uniref:GyrI-like domain-containing protein n=1 Tax=Devosia sp. UYZn731 TaxID=3156345 RepID=UPI003391B3B4